MVKFGRKFFFDTKHSKKRRIITYIVVGILIIVAIVIAALIIKKLKKKPNKPEVPTPKTEIVLRKELDAELYSPLPNKVAYFEKLENFNIDDIIITYPDYLPLDPVYDNCSEDELKIIEDIKNGQDDSSFNNPYSCVFFVPTGIGAYDVKVTYNDKDYTVTLNVVDTTAPKLVVKNLEIVEGTEYSVNDFVESCVDNSKKDCSYDYYYKEYSPDINYGKYTEPGTYNISLVAIDGSGNTSVPEDATLIITEKVIQVFTVTFNSNGGSAIDQQFINEGEQAKAPEAPTKSGYTFTGWYTDANTKFDFNTPINSDITLVAKWNKNSTPTPKTPTTTCSNGDLKYDTSKYPYVALFVSNNNCAISKNDLTSITYGNKAKMVMSKEYSKLQEWQKQKGVDYCIAVVNNEPQGVPNNSGKGFVGYTIQFSIIEAEIDYTTKECKNFGAEVARYFLDSEGKRHFSLNTINLPES